MRTASDALLLATSAVALFAGISLLSAHNSTARGSLDPLEKIEINLPNLTWIERIQLNAQTKTIAADSADRGAITEIQFAKYLPKRIVKRLARKANPPPFIRSVIAKTEISDLKKEVDKISWSHAAALPVGLVGIEEPFDLPAPSGACDSNVTSGASNEELQRIQDMHRSLRSSFNTAFLMIADPIDEAPIASVTTQERKVSLAQKKKAIRKHQTKTTIVKTKSQDPVAAVAMNIQPVNTQASAPIVKAKELSASSAEQLLPPKTAPPIAKTLEKPQVIQAQMAVTKVEKQDIITVTQAASLSTPSDENREVAPTQPVVQVIPHAQTTRVSKLDIQFAPAPAVPAAAPAAKKSSQMAVAGYLNKEGNGRILMAANPQELADAAMDSQYEENQKSPMKAEFVEGFEWVTPVYGVRSETVTSAQDPDTNNVRGWRVARSKGYWPTYYWKVGKSSDVNQGILSENAANLLGTLSQRTAQSQAGIVFGKVAAGWGVELSGRAEAPIYLTVKNEVVKVDDRSQDRYFAILNVEPGAHLVYLTGAKAAEDFAVVVPVWAGGATSLDLSRVKTTSILGRIYDAGSAELKPLARAEVKIVGQPKNTLTSKSGEFSFPGVWTVGDYPLVLESRFGKEYSHRFNVNTDKLRNVTLFRIPAREIENWISELDGGVSADGGIVLAAVPRLVAEQKENGLYPAMSLTSERKELQFETYTLSEQGHLLVHTPLEGDLLRYISVQVPQGPVITQVQDKTGATVMSELVFAQPGILNVVGPY